MGGQWLARLWLDPDTMPNAGNSKPPQAGFRALISAADADAVAAAGRLIRDGALVAFATETVYGLGADATNGEAVARIFAAKGRPSFNPLIVHVSNQARAAEYGNFSAAARRLADRFWPGPLTLVLPRRAGAPIADLVSAGLPTLALRVPHHPIAQALLAAADRPIAAPSANRSGHVSATEAAHVADDLGDRVAMILDGGAAQHGLESTVVDATGDSLVLLRPGAITRQELQVAAQQPVLDFSGNTTRPHSPGQLDSHYAPRANIRLNATDVRDGEALLAFGPHALTTRAAVLNISPSGDIIEAAARLFASLRTLDATGCTTIAVMPIPSEGLGEAINDRLRRAAAPRA